MEEKKDYKLYLDTATLAGKLMLQNGAEIYRTRSSGCWLSPASRRQRPM